MPPPNRPGMGHSTNVPLPQRLAVWLETATALLKHLGIGHVALVSHSAGTIYNLNLLYHFRDILSPTKPFVALFGRLLECFKLFRVKPQRTTSYPTPMLRNVLTPCSTFCAPYTLSSCIPADGSMVAKSSVQCLASYPTTVRHQGAACLRFKWGSVHQSHQRHFWEIRQQQR